MKINGKYFHYWLVLILILGSLKIYPQTIPNYSERSIFAEAENNKSSDKTSQTEKQSAGTTSFSKSVDDPESYVLGAGDRLFISIMGVENLTFDLIISPEGTIFLPEVGIIELKLLNLIDGKEKIKNEILNKFKDVHVDISLTDVKIINVNLIGDVVKAASFNLPANLRLSDLISLSEGLNTSANLRDVEVIDQKGLTNNYDLLSYLRLGDFKNNPYLRDAHIIKIKRTDKLVSIYGAVPYYGDYEFKHDESVIDLINLAGGLTDKSRRDTIEVISFLDDNETLESRYYSYNELMKSNITLKRGDKVVIREKTEYLTDRLVVVKGFVKSPGVYKIQKGVTTLRSIMLNEAGGFLEEASLRDAYIVRYNDESEEEDPEFERLKHIEVKDMTEDEYDYFKAKSREKKGRMIVDFEKLFLHKDLKEDIILKKGDKIFVPEAKNFITLVGQVVNPGNIIYKENLTVEDYISTAGGFSYRAIEGDVRVIKANTGEWIEADDVESLAPGDIIWVPEEVPGPKFWDVFMDSLTVVGQIATVVAAVIAVVIASRN